MKANSFIILVLVLALAVQLTRALPFILFKDKKDLPKLITYLSKVLPASMMGLLVIYCFKDYDYSMVNNYLPALIATISIVIIHSLKRNTILSIGLGTVIYMLLIRLF